MLKCEELYKRCTLCYAFKYLNVLPIRGIHSAIGYV